MSVFQGMQWYPFRTEFLHCSMFYIHKPKPWDKLKPIDEKYYLDRRKILKNLGMLSGAILASPTLLSACVSGNSADQEIQQEIDNKFTFDGIEKFFTSKRNNKYVLDREITDEYSATHNNNFYEFIHPSDSNIYNAYKYVDKFDNREWKFEVSGYALNTGTFYLEDIIKKFGQEERTYRFRCVERWAMAVPWTGIPLAKLISYFNPTSKAKYVRMLSFADKEQMIGVKNQPWYSWPYFEGLRMDEAMNELALMVTGIFGKPLPKQNGAPMRLIVPWKYGYKNTKSIVKIEFIGYEPETFWHKVAPNEYGFYSNIDPEVPHPRWSQARERMLPDGDWRPTLKYNGYEEYVAGMY